MQKKTKKPPGISPPVFKIPVTPGFLYDDRSGDKKMFKGRTKDRSLESLESPDDKKIAKLLDKEIAAGVRFVQQEQTYKKLEHPPWVKPISSKKRKKK